MSDCFRPPQLNEQAFRHFARFVTSRLGIRMPPGKLMLIQSRLLRRLRDLGLERFEDYEDLLFRSASAAEEQRRFIDLVTTNKTDFFREPDHFDFLAKSVLPNQARGNFPVWSAGCSSGEEVYTLGMVLADFASTHPGFDFSVLGTDVSERMLALAREAIYDETRVAPVPLEQRRRHLLRGRPPRTNLVRVAPELRARVRFQHLNLMDEGYALPGDMALIFFRNVMIYFDRATQFRVLSHLCRHLRAGGLLFISHTESILELRDLPLRPLTPSIFRRL